MLLCHSSQHKTLLLRSFLHTCQTPNSTQSNMQESHICNRLTPKTEPAQGNYEYSCYEYAVFTGWSRIQYNVNAQVKDNRFRLRLVVLVTICHCVWHFCTQSFINTAGHMGEVDSEDLIHNETTKTITQSTEKHQLKL